MARTIRPISPKLLEAFETTDGGLVAGVRVARQDNAVRRISSRLANGVRRALLKDGMTDSGCGLRVLPRETFLRLPYFDHIHRFVPALAKREGCQVVAVPVNHRPRSRGTSKYGVGNRLLVGVVDLFGVLWLLRRRRRPEVTIEKGDSR